MEGIVCVGASLMLFGGDLAKSGEICPKSAPMAAHSCHDAGTLASDIETFMLALLVFTWMEWISVSLSDIQRVMLQNHCHSDTFQK